MNICSGDFIKIVEVAGRVLSIIKIVVPIILIVMGSIDLTKAIMAGKEDEIKQGQAIFIKRSIAAILVFFVPIIVSLLLSVINQDKTSCLMCFLDTSTCNTSSSGLSGSGSGEIEGCTFDNPDCISDEIFIEN